MDLPRFACRIGSRPRSIGTFPILQTTAATTFAWPVRTKSRDPGMFTSRARCVSNAPVFRRNRPNLIRRRGFYGASPLVIFARTLIHRTAMSTSSTADRYALSWIGTRLHADHSVHGVQERPCLPRPAADRCGLLFPCLRGARRDLCRDAGRLALSLASPGLSFPDRTRLGDPVARHITVFHSGMTCS